MPITTPPSSLKLVSSKVEIIIRGRFHRVNKTEAQTVSMVCVFCPEDDIIAVSEQLASMGVEAIINPSEVNLERCPVICHHKSALLPREIRRGLLSALSQGAWVQPLVSYLEERNGYAPVELLYSGYFLEHRVFSIVANRRSIFVKRLVDLLIAVPMAVLLAPLVGVLAILVKLDSKGPAFYRQDRVGLGGREFAVVKLRTMRVDAEEAGPQWATEDDPRTTRLGKFLRKTRLDELPQLWNVLLGDMSLVGPRPERRVFVEKLEKEIPFYSIRHAVKPGITGLAQVSYPYGATIEDAVWKHKYDLYYIRHHSIWMDIKILFKTVLVVFGAKGR